MLLAFDIYSLIAVSDSLEPHAGRFEVRGNQIGDESSYARRTVPGATSVRPRSPRRITHDARVLLIPVVRGGPSQIYSTRRVCLQSLSRLHIIIAARTPVDVTSFGRRSACCAID